MATLKSVFPTWQNMWAGYSQNYWEKYYDKTLGRKAIHILVLHSVYNYWKNDEFENDEESAIDKIMVLIRGIATRLSQNQELYDNIRKKLVEGDYKQLKESTRENLSPFYRKNIPLGSITKTGNVEHQGLTYPQTSQERITRPPQVSQGQRQINQTTLTKQYPLNKNWIARMSNSFVEAGIDLETEVRGLHSIFCRVYPFEEGKFFFDESTKEYKWKGKRSEEEIEIDPVTGQPLDDESLRDIDKPEYNQWKSENKLGLRPTWYLEGTYRFLGRLQKEIKKLAANSKTKQEQRIESAEKLIKIYEKVYERPTIEYFMEKLNEMEGFEEAKNIVGNYFVNLLSPADVSFRPLSFILVGPPGTGKSAFAAKTAEASKRTFIKIPMNGQNEPAYLKGREIAYAGADQGKILKEILNKGSCEAVVLIDELTRAGSKALTDIVGTMTDPDQNESAFEDDWLKWKLDLSRMVFFIADNHLEKIDPFLLSRSLVVKIPILSYGKRVEIVKKNLTKLLSKEEKLREYVNQITDDFCKYIICEEWGIRQTLSNINILFLALRANSLMNNPINDVSKPKEVIKEDLSYTLVYESGQKIILVRARDIEKKLDGTIHTVLTDIGDWPEATLHDEKQEREKITILDLSEQGLYNFDFTRYPKLEILEIYQNNFKNLDLSTNSKLKRLNLNENNLLGFNGINFGEIKDLEEIHLIGIKEGEIIDLKKFKKLKKISYDWKVEAVYLDKNLKNKVEIINPALNSLPEDEIIEYQHHYPQTTYETLVRDKVVFGETE